MIILENVCKRFGDSVVLDHICAHLTTGEIHGLVGDNGSGKSVLLKCMAGLLPYDSGEILLNGEKVRAGRSPKVRIGLIIEHPGFLNEMSGYHNLQYLAGIRGIAGKQKIFSALDAVGLADAAHKRAGKYSLGMRQRLAIAQAIMEDPQLLLMDEPFNGLDRTAVQQMRQLFLELKKQGKTLVIASHYPEDIEVLCDHVYEVSQGKLSKI